MVFSFEDDEQDIQVDGEAQEKKEEEEPKEEKQEQKKEEEEEDEQDIMKVLGNLVVALFIKYWIYVCGGMFFFVSFEGKIVMYKIIYMVLFLFCVALYQVGMQLSLFFNPNICPGTYVSFFRQDPKLLWSCENIV